MIIFLVHENSENWVFKKKLSRFLKILYFLHPSSPYTNIQRLFFLVTTTGLVSHSWNYVCCKMWHASLFWLRAYWGVHTLCGAVLRRSTKLLVVCHLGRNSQSAGERQLAWTSKPGSTGGIFIPYSHNMSDAAFKMENCFWRDAMIQRRIQRWNGVSVHNMGHKGTWFEPTIC